MFNNPNGVATDTGGNVYVSDGGNNTIRKVTPSGAVTTLAGTPGGKGSADGNGAAASFNLPFGVATDGSGDVYVADVNNNTIRKITPAGVVSTLAGSPGVAGSADGLGAAARFNGPNYVVADSVGNVYVSDSGNSVIRKITPAGNVTTVIGQKNVAGFTPGALPGLIAYPDGLALFKGTLYISQNCGVEQVTNVP
jgi:streptogramin lyase